WPSASMPLARLPGRSTAWPPAGFPPSTPRRSGGRWSASHPSRLRARTAGVRCHRGHGPTAARARSSRRLLALEGALIQAEALAQQTRTIETIGLQAAQVVYGIDPIEARHVQLLLRIEQIQQGARPQRQILVAVQV